MPYNKVKKRDRFYKLLTIDNIVELEKMVKEEPLIKDYANKLKELSKDEKYKEEIMTEAMDKYFMEMEAYEAGEERGIKQGIEQGIEKNQQNIVLNMYEDKVSFKTISKYTKLSIDKIKEIVNNKNN